MEPHNVILLFHAAELWQSTEMRLSPLLPSPTRQRNQRERDRERDRERGDEGEGGGMERKSEANL